MQYLLARFNECHKFLIKSSQTTWRAMENLKQHQYYIGQVHEEHFRISRWSWSEKIWNITFLLYLVKFLRLPIPFDPVMNFMWLSGDWNDIHYDCSAAKKSPIGCIALPGFLVFSSIFSRILGTKFPGNGTVLKNIDHFKFSKPLIANTSYLAVIKIEDISTITRNGTLVSKLYLYTEILSQDKKTKYYYGYMTVVKNTEPS